MWLIISLLLQLLRHSKRRSIADHGLLKNPTMMTTPYVHYTLPNIQYLRGTSTPRSRIKSIRCIRPPEASTRATTKPRPPSRRIHRILCRRVHRLRVVHRIPRHHRVLPARVDNNFYLRVAVVHLRPPLVRHTLWNSNHHDPVSIHSLSVHAFLYDRCGCDSGLIHINYYKVKLMYMDMDDRELRAMVVRLSIAMYLYILYTYTYSSLMITT